MFVLSVFSGEMTLWHWVWHNRDVQSLALLTGDRGGGSWVYLTRASGHDIMFIDNVYLITWNIYHYRGQWEVMAYLHGPSGC